MALELTLLPRVSRHRPAPSALPLALRATLALRLPRGARIAVGAGRVWLTEASGLDDHFIAAGGQHVVQRAGVVVLEGDSPVTAQLRITRR